MVALQGRCESKGAAGNMKIFVTTVRSGEMSREADGNRNNGVLLSQPPEKSREV